MIDQRIKPKEIVLDRKAQLDQRGILPIRHRPELRRQRNMSWTVAQLNWCTR